MSYELELDTLVKNQKLIREVIEYDPENGTFRWKPRGREFFNTEGYFKSWNTRFAGKLAGSAFSAYTRNKDLPKDYMVIRILGLPVLAHRLAFLIKEGWLPEAVGHIDTNGLNNKWDNLCASSRYEVGKSMRKSLRNTSGHAGVNYIKACGKWQARIRTDGDDKYLGIYENIEDAIKARKEAEIKYGFSNIQGD